MKLYFIFIIFHQINILVYSYNSPKYTYNLAKKNYKLCPFYANKIINRYNLKLNVDQKNEIYQEGYLGLVLACRKYDKSKGASLSTYSYFWINRYVYKYLKDFIFNKPVEYIINYNIYPTLDKPIFDDNIFKSLNENEKKVINLRYFKNNKVKDISCSLNVSRNTVTKWCNSAKIKIEKEINKN